MLIRLVFVVWVVTITVLAVIPHADDGLMVASNVTSSGMEKYVVGYFVGVFLLYYGYVKRGARGKAESVRGLAQSRTHEKWSQDKNLHYREIDFF